MRKAALHNLGCKVNAYETEAMQQILEKAGYEIVPFHESADVYVINTCSVTNMADRKSRQMIHRAKHQNPDAIVVAAGCYVQTSGEEAAKDAAVDIVLGNNRKGELVKCIEELLRQRGQSNMDSETRQRAGSEKQEIPRKGDLVENRIDINAGEQEYEEMFLSRTAEHTRAFLKVQDGCNQFCSYCIIPYARGRVRSRHIESVLAEVQRLADAGYREVVLTGIHLSSYGVDTNDNLLHLIQEVHKVQGIERIRLGSLEPKIVTEEFARELSLLDKVCPHFHLSLQSGCDETLRRMNRRYTTEEYEMGCQMLRKYFRHPAITTDVIVGFPGETEEEFAQTKEFLRRIHFYEMHIFKYSRRKGTRADRMENQIPEPVKTARSAELIALGERMSRKFCEDYVGTTQEVLFEEKTRIEGQEYYVGYTKEYVKIARSSEISLENQIISGEIVQALANDLYLMK